MPHANSQPPVISGANLRMNVAQSVVARMAATELELDLARYDIQLVMRH